MRLDHIAYRTANRDKTADFFIKAFGYKLADEFDIFFNDEKTEKARCYALEPPEKLDNGVDFFSYPVITGNQLYEFHLAPEIFVSEGTPGSIVGDWVEKRDGIGGIHHLAYQVESVEEKVKEWRDNGFANFSSEKPFTCEDLTQIFSEYHPLTGVIYEFIERRGKGFCKENVKELMRASAQMDGNMK